MMETEGLSRWSGVLCQHPSRPSAASRDRRLAQSPRRSRSSHRRTCIHAYSRRSVRLGEAGGGSAEREIQREFALIALGSASRRVHAVRSQPALECFLLCDPKMVLCLVKCSYAPTKPEEDTLVPVTSHPSFLLTYFSIPISPPYLGLGRGW